MATEENKTIANQKYESANSTKEHESHQNLPRSRRIVQIFQLIS